MMSNIYFLIRIFFVGILSGFIFYLSLDHNLSNKFKCSFSVVQLLFSMFSSSGLRLFYPPVHKASSFIQHLLSAWIINKSKQPWLFFTMCDCINTAIIKRQISQNKKSRDLNLGPLYSKPTILLLSHHTSVFSVLQKITITY